MQDDHRIYTSREEVEKLLHTTLGFMNSKGKAPIKKEKSKLSAGKIIRRAAYGLLLLALLGMLGKVWFARLSGSVPELFGYQMYSVETGSMIPSLPIGSTIIVKSLGPGQAPSVGDIITYNRESAVITHRITEEVAEEDGAILYQTQGDNPDNSADPWLVPLEDVRGIVVWHFTLPWAGR